MGKFHDSDCTFDAVPTLSAARDKELAAKNSDCGKSPKSGNNISSEGCMGTKACRPHNIVESLPCTCFECRLLPWFTRPYS